MLEPILSKEWEERKLAAKVSMELKEKYRQKLEELFKDRPGCLTVDRTITYVECAEMYTDSLILETRSELKFLRAILSAYGNVEYKVHGWNKDLALKGYILENGETYEP